MWCATHPALSRALTLTFWVRSDWTRLRLPCTLSHEITREAKQEAAATAGREPDAPTTHKPTPKQTSILPQTYANTASSTLIAAWCNGVSPEALRLLTSSRSASSLVFFLTNASSCRSVRPVISAGLDLLSKSILSLCWAARNDQVSRSLGNPKMVEQPARKPTYFLAIFQTFCDSFYPAPLCPAQH